MILTVKLDNQSFDFDTSLVKDLSIPLQFNGSQPRVYDVNRAISHAFEGDGFIGDTRKGGACNFEQLTLVPHCNGTHTECIGHITHQRFSVQEQLKDSLIPCTLISIVPENAMNSSEDYDPPKEKGDFFISRSALEKALKPVSKVFLKALIIRTLPNDNTKMSRNYSAQKPPFLSLDAMNFITELGVEHILVDLPSIDRAYDQGKLNTHHLFWNVASGSHETSSHSLVNKTITEMIYAADEILDGSYLLNLQIAPFASDAAPSRPLLYPLIKA